MMSLIGVLAGLVVLLMIWLRKLRRDVAHLTSAYKDLVDSQEMITDAFRNVRSDALDAQQAANAAWEKVEDLERASKRPATKRPARSREAA